jgi:glycosyltransferase involved in cell wall biosynthesis
MRIGGILSVYKGDSPIFLRQALESIIRNQTKIFDECVGVIEGEIGHELEDVCKNFPEIKWFNTIESDVFGLPTALNMAVENINVEVVLKIDTDDLYSSRRIEWSYSAFKNDDSLDLHGGQVMEFSNDFKLNYGYRNVPLNQSDIEKYFKYRNPFNGPSVAFRKDSFLKMGGFPQVGANEDYCLWGLYMVNKLCVSNSAETYAFMRGGRDLVYRRSNKTYRFGELQALKFMKDSGALTNSQYLRHIFVKQIIRRLPLKWNSYIYSKLRKNIEHKIPKELEDVIQTVQK